jgi:hypothetical protein
MALLDLSLPSKTLVRLVDEAIQISPVKPAQTVNVTSLPPDRLVEVDNAIGIYLFHVVEEAAYRNKVWPKRPDHPRYVPLGLNLHYIVSAHSNLGEPFGPYREQLLMGMALKALHDYPCIDDFTEISNHKILDPSLVGDENRIKLSLRHIPSSEAVSYWTAGSQPLRLSAYYEVSVVLVEPDEPTVARGRVLTTGIEMFIGGLPRLSASRSTVSFTIPTETTPRQVSVQPAQVAIGDEMTLIGSALAGGTLELRVRGPGWLNPLPVGPTWGVSGGADTMYATVQELIDVEPALPGSYTALIAVTRSRTLPDGTTHSTVVTSNEAPFQIVPQVASVGAVGAGGVFTITGGIFADAKLPAGSVRASIGDVALVEHASPLAPGQFEIVSPQRIDMALPSTAVPGTYLPFRIIINGAESAPSWVQVP